jgi:hypothetical protein
MSTLTINEGFDKATGIVERTHFEDGSIVIQKTFDAQPLVDYAKMLREATEGKRWGNGMVIASIPLEAAARFRQMDPDQRDRELNRYLLEHPEYICYDKALK